MLKFDQYSSIASREKVDASGLVIYGVCVMSEGEAKGHGVQLDKKSLETFMVLTKDRPDGVGTRFGDDHEAKAKDFNGTLKNFRMENSGKWRVIADLHLLGNDEHTPKLLEMAEKMPNEFGLSAVTDAEKEIVGEDKNGNPKYKFISPIRFESLDCVDIVSSPAATNGLFLSENNTNQHPTMIKEFALLLGLPETATEAEVKLALEAKCKYEAEAKKKLEAEEEEKKKLEAEEEAKKKKLEAEADYEGKGKDAKKKFEAEFEAMKLQLAKIEGSANAAAASAHKAEIETLKLEAGKDGKVIPISDESLMKLSVPEVKDMIAKLPKGQVKLEKGSTQPVSKDGKAINKNTPEFKAYLAERKAAGALQLDQHFNKK